MNYELKSIKNRLNDAIKFNEKALKYFEDKNFLNDFRKKVKVVSNFMHLNKNKLLTSSKILVSDIDKIINKFWNEKNKIVKSKLNDLLLFKILVINCGLGLGRTQFRLNANQLNNAISREIELTGDPEGPIK